VVPGSPPTIDRTAGTPIHDILVLVYKQRDGRVEMTEEYQAGCNPELADRRDDHVKIADKYNMELVAGNFFFTTYTPGTDVLLCYFNYCTGEPLPFLIPGVNDGPECQGP
jgi:hypothetical protein